jgi:argininosuccinate lyase
MSAHDDGAGKAPHLKGRINKPMHPALADASASVHFDKKLALSEIVASRGHASLLQDAGVFTEDEYLEIVKALDLIEGRIADGSFVFDPALEDVHMNIEKALMDICGPVGAKIQTGRSRNEQVVVDERLYIVGELLNARKDVLDLREALLTRAEEAGDRVMPGYTHMQRAQPILVAHHLMAYHQIFLRDYERLEYALSDCVSIPYGAGALAGTSFKFKPSKRTRALGLVPGYHNSMDVVSSRDHVYAFLSFAAILSINLSRLGEELAVWSGPEFNYISFPEDLSTTSSMMPQKKNPDGAELLRGKSGRTVGNLISLLTVLKGLPLTYNRDLQEDKEPLFDSAETLRLTLPLAIALVKGMELHYDVMEQNAQDTFMAAGDLADRLVQRGVPVRDAFIQVARLAGLAKEKGVPLDGLGPLEVQACCPAADPHFLEKISAQDQVGRRNTTRGATGPKMVRRAVAAAKRLVERERETLLRVQAELDENGLPGVIGVLTGEEGISGSPFGMFYDVDDDDVVEEDDILDEDDDDDYDDDDDDDGDDDDDDDDGILPIEDYDDDKD